MFSFATHMYHDAPRPSPSPTRPIPMGAAPDLPPTTPVVTPPPQAHYSLLQHQHDLISEFFGGRVERLHRDNAAPPPYAPTTDVEKLPPYEAKSPLDETPMTKYMFMYGFAFPLFWIMGVVILRSPLQLTSDWHPEKPEEERREMMEKMREVEMVWAKRCLWALVALVAIILVIVLAIVIAKFA